MADADVQQFFPIFQRTEEDLRADYDARANVGLTPDDPDWVDTRQGSQFYLCTQPSIIENALVYDRMNEIAAASLLATSWGEYLDLHAASYSDERVGASSAVGEVTFAGDDGTLVATGVRVSPVQTDPEVEPPFFETTGSGVIAAGVLTLPIRALELGIEGNVGAGTITQIVSGADDGVTGVTNADALSQGADVETDASLKTRLRMLFKGKGSGTWPDYAREALRWPGVGFVKVDIHWAGPGTVRVWIRDDAGNPVNPTVVTDFQNYLDPVPGQGKGWAPINHVVTAATPTQTTVHASATVMLADGYILSDVADLVTEAYNAYVDSLEPDGDVVFNQALGAMVKASEGVANITDLKLDTVDPPVAAVDVAIAADHIATPGNVTLV